jgi:hypothetical protein
MSAIGKTSLGYKKLDTLTDKPLALGYKKLVFAHKFTSAGLTDIDLTALNPPTELTSLGFVNPTSNDLLNAQLGITRQNLRLVSSLHGLLMDFLSYDVIANNLIRLKDGAVSTINEIVVGYIEPVNMTGLLAVDAFAIVQTGQLGVGLTDIVVGSPFTYDKYEPQQAGDVLLYLDGILQMRNLGNTPSGSGNFYEIAPITGGLSNTLRVNTAPVGTPKNYVITSNGLVAERPTAAVLAKIDTQGGQIDAIIQDLAVVTGNPTSHYQTAPNSVDLAMFANVVKSYITEVHYDFVVGSSAQVNAGKATHTTIGAALSVAFSGAKILVLQGTYVENVTITNKVFLEGKGNGSFINGTLTIQPGGSYSAVKWLRWGGNITLQTSANAIFLRECWQVTGLSISDSGTANSVLVIQE